MKYSVEGATRREGGSPICRGRGLSRHYKRWGAVALLLSGSLGGLITSATAAGPNLILNGEAFEKWQSLNGVAVAANTMAAPNGAVTGDRLTDNASKSGARMMSNTVTTNGEQHVFSVYLKGGSLRQAVVTVHDFVTNTRSENIASLSGDWQRVVVVVPAGASSRRLRAEVYPGHYRAEQGDVYAWGALLEKGVTPSPYPGASDGGSTPSPDTTPPAAPAGVTAQLVSGSIQVNWSANAETDLAGYRVERSVNSTSAFSQVATPTVPGYTDPGVSAGNTYHYRVRAVDKAGNVSGASAIASVSVASTPPPPADTTAPAAPTGVTAQLVSGSVQVKWNASSESDFASYRVERGVNSSTSFSQVASPTQPSYADTSVTAGNTYYYRVRAADKTGNVSSPSAVVSVTLPNSPPPPAEPVDGKSRGYFTTPQELRIIAQKAAAGTQPYKAAVDQMLAYAKDPAYWPYGTISGSQTASSVNQPAFIGWGNRLMYAKAMAYHITGNAQYAAVVREKILDLVDTYYYGGEKYSGGNQNILNLSWYIPGIIQAADLLEGYPGWTQDDKRSFQRWLATEIFKKVEWASDVRSNNWGTAGSGCAAIIADYLWDGGIPLITRTGAQVTPKQAYDEAKLRQLDRMKGNTYMDNYGAHMPGVGIRPDGGIPEELMRGTTGATGLWIVDLDGSWSYSQTYVEGIQAHAELLLRRGDRSMYDYKTSTGAGSILKAIHFLINNPNDPSRSVNWHTGRKPQLELAYRYYRDSHIGKQLGVGTSSRFIGGYVTVMVYWGTLTHGFAPGENPAAPPTVTPPTW